MGAAVTIELTKPPDGSDIISTGSLEYAKNEVIRLRCNLGCLAVQHGMQVMPENADDLVLGENETEDFDRVVKEICHIRACLRLNTQSSKRRSRYNLTTDESAASHNEMKMGGDDDEDSCSDDSDSDS